MNSSQTMAFICVFKLHEGRYYVETTDRPEKRYQLHKAASDVPWIKVYFLKEMEKVMLSEYPLQVDVIVKQYMTVYGIDKVRGGSYRSFELSDTQRALLEKEIQMLEQKCRRCGKDNHFIEECYAERRKEGQSEQQGEWFCW